MTSKVREKSAFHSAECEVSKCHAISSIECRKRKLRQNTAFDSILNYRSTSKVSVVDLSAMCASTMTIKSCDFDRLQ